MNEKLLILFVCLSITNVIISTIKSLCTIKCGKGVAAIINAIAYGFNVVMTVYMVSDLPLGVKALAVGLCNLIGVYLVKWVEEKLRKDKLWKVEATILREDFEDLKTKSKELDLTYNFIDIDKYFLINYYCATQKDSAKVKDLLKNYHVKYFVNESKEL